MSVHLFQKRLSQSKFQETKSNNFTQAINISETPASKISYNGQSEKAIKMSICKLNVKDTS